MTLTRLRSVLLAVLIVSSAVLASPGVGTVAAVHDCSNTDAAVYGFSFGYINENKCTNNHVDQAVERVRDAEEQQTKVDIYAASGKQQERTETFGTVYDNYLQDTDSVAWMKAEAAIAEAHERGDTKVEAKAAAKAAIQDYYAVKQINLIEDWNSTYQGMEYLDNRTDQESSISSDYIHVYREDNFKDEKAYTEDVPQWGLTVDETLVNGSTHTSYAIGTYSGSCCTGAAHPSRGNVSVEGDTIYDIRVKPPDSDFDTLHLVFWPYEKRWTRIETKSDELVNESNTYVDAIWQDLEEGNLNSSEIISRQTRMFEYGTAAQNGSSGSYYDVLGATSAMGLAAPELNETGQMTITDSAGNSYEGMLFARNPPNGKWEVGRTYDPGNISGPVQFASKDGSLRELEEPFTLESATDKSGASRSTVETKDYNYRTSDASQTREKYNRLLGLTEDLQQRSESVESEGGGGGGGSSGGSLPDWLSQTYFGIPVWAFAAVGLLILVLLGGGS